MHVSTRFPIMFPCVCPPPPMPIQKVQVHIILDYGPHPPPPSHPLLPIAPEDATVSGSRKHTRALWSPEVVFPNPWVLCLRRSHPEYQWMDTSHKVVVRSPRIGSKTFSFVLAQDYTDDMFVKELRDTLDRAAKLVGHRRTRGPPPKKMHKNTHTREE